MNATRALAAVHHAVDELRVIDLASLPEKERLQVQSWVRRLTTIEAEISRWSDGRRA